MRFVLALAVVACSHAPEPRGDWCGTTRAEIRWAGELAEKCDAGDFLACERAAGECRTGRAFFCASAPPRATATPAELDARLAASCDAGNADDCVEHGELLEREGVDPAPAYLRACDHGRTAACELLGERDAARANDAETAGDWAEAARLHRIACFKRNVAEQCAALDAFRARAKREATECEAGRSDVCARAATMLRASSQGPADDARADELKRRISR